MKKFIIIFAVVLISGIVLTGIGWGFSNLLDKQEGGLLIRNGK